MTNNKMIHAAPLSSSHKKKTHIYSPIQSSRCVEDKTSLFNTYCLFVVLQTDSRDWRAAETRLSSNVAIFLSDRFPKTFLMEALRATFTVLFTGCRVSFVRVTLHVLRARSLFSWFTSSLVHQRDDQTASVATKEIFKCTVFYFENYYWVQHFLSWRCCLCCSFSSWRSHFFAAQTLNRLFNLNSMIYLYRHSST